MEGRLEPLFLSPPDRTDESAVQAAQGLIRISHAAHDPVIVWPTKKTKARRGVLLALVLFLLMNVLAFG